MEGPAPIRVFFVDDHFIAREGLRSIVACEPDMVVAGEAANGEDAVKLFANLNPDVTLMDIRLPGRNGIETILDIRKQHPVSRFVVLTSHDGDELIHRALESGVQGYLYKDMVRTELTAAIRMVHAGRKYIPVPVASRLYEHQPRLQLTPRELDVLRHVANGRSNREIAAELRIKEFTVKSHVQSLLAKLEASDRTHAVTIASKRGLLFI
jgi:DNA-binding NarL/FixJ family response regulator